MPPPAPMHNDVDTRTIVRVSYALVGLVLFGFCAATTATGAPPKSAARGPEADAAAIYAAAAGRFRTTFESGGMMGVADVIDDCYKRAAPQATSSCVAFDSVAQVMADSVARLGLPPPLDFLKRPAFDARVKKQLRLHGVDEKQMDGVIRVMLDQAGVALNVEYNSQQRKKIRLLPERAQIFEKLPTY